MADGWVLGDRYRIQDRLGSGGMAEVFRAHDQLLDRPVAVKVFRSAHVAADAPAGMARQQTELQALARLNHPNLITLYDGSITGTPAYLVMELIDGPSLGNRIAQGPLPEPEVREIGAQLADGLAYVHAQGMVHRDVKPDNILLGVDRSGEDSTVRARLSDFGIVRLLGAERMTSADFTLGTASYLAPEQARGSSVEPPADVYSLALVLLEALTGTRSFDGPPLEAAIARLSNRPSIPPDLPAPWPGLLHAMTELDPAARPTAAQVARALRTNANDTTSFIPGAGAGLAAAATQMIGTVPAAGAAGAAAAGTSALYPPPGGPRPPMPPAGPRGVGEPIGPPPDDGGRRNGLLITAAVLALVVIIAGVILAIILTGSGKSPSTGTSTTPSSSASKTASSSKSKPSRTRSTTRSSSTSSSTSESTSSSTSSSSSSSSSSKPPSSSTSSSTTSRPPSSSSRSTSTTSRPPSSSSTTTSSSAATSAVAPLGNPPTSSGSASASSAVPTP